MTTSFKLVLKMTLLFFVIFNVLVGSTEGFKMTKGIKDEIRSPSSNKITQGINDELRSPSSNPNDFDEQQFLCCKIEPLCCVR